MLLTSSAAAQGQTLPGHPTAHCHPSSHPGTQPRCSSSSSCSGYPHSRTSQSATTDHTRTTTPHWYRRLPRSNHWTHGACRRRSSDLTVAKTTLMRTSTGTTTPGGRMRRTRREGGREWEAVRSDRVRASRGLRIHPQASGRWAGAMRSSATQVAACPPREVISATRMQTQAMDRRTTKTRTGS